MPNFTTFLNLTLPAFGEFANTWNQVLNENFEDLDDYLLDLNNNLVGTGTGSRFAQLRGTLTNLGNRLDVSIQADGSIDLTSSPTVLALGLSRYLGNFSSPAERSNNTDREIYEASQPAAGSRFSPIDELGPVDGYPYSSLDAGIALRGADFGLGTANPLGSPKIPWSPGLVLGGASNFIIDNGNVGQVRLVASSRAALFNIDGYIFRAREDIDLDYSAIAGLSFNDYVWIYVEREETNYNTGGFLYGNGDAPAARDLRVRKSGSDGSASDGTSVFQSDTSTFDQTPWRVRAGDILRITGGANVGSYVIESVDSDTLLTVRGEFIGEAGMSFDIYDPAMPNIGAAISSGTPSILESAPPYADGRVYIGYVQYTSPSPSTPVTFTRGGVYDSGWITVTEPLASSSPPFPLILNHNLGVQPSSVDIWVRESSTDQAYKPLVRRQVLTNFDTGDTTVDPGDPKAATLLMPSVFHRSSETIITIEALNQSTDPATDIVLFTDTAGDDQPQTSSSAQIRVIARR